LEEKLRDVVAMPKEEAEALGYEDNYKEEALKQIDNLRKLKKDYIDISNKFYEDKYQSKIGDIYKSKVDRDRLTEDLISTKREIEGHKYRILDKVTSLSREANTMENVDTPILEDKINRLVDLQRRLSSKKTRELKTPSGRKTKNKRIVAKVNRA